MKKNSLPPLKTHTVTLDDGTTATIEIGSGNVFADLGFENAEEMQFKAGLIHEILQIIKARRLTQTQAAKIIGMDQPTLSKMLRGQFLSLSVERLFEILNRLGRRVEVRVIAPADEDERARTLLVA